MPIFFREPGWNPQGELEQLQRRMDRLFQNAYGREGRPGWVGVYPLVNISEDRDHILVRAELPGVQASRPGDHPPGPQPDPQGRAQDSGGRQAGQLSPPGAGIRVFPADRAPARSGAGR